MKPVFLRHAFMNADHLALRAGMCGMVCLITLLVACPETAPAQSGPANSTSTAELLNRMWSRGQAEGRGPVKLKSFPLRVEDISHINPMGAMASGHVTPNDHLSLVGKEPKTRLYDVLAVAAGQVIGKVRGGFTFDFAWIDTTATRAGFVRPEQFLKRDPWKPHTVDPFDYVDEPMRSRLLALNPRKAAPLGGKIDYDVDGRLVGNWYRAGTGGYAGLNRRWDYWVGHLTIAYHHVDPSQIIVSIGDFEGRARQFQVRGNAPDPAKISEAEGVVKYDLIMPMIENRTGRPYLNAEPRSVGVLLAQVLPNQKLRMEALPGRTAAQVQSFTAEAKIYER